MKRRLILKGTKPKGFFGKLLSFMVWATLTVGCAGVLGAIGAWVHYGDGLPEIPQVESYRPPILSEVYTDDAVLAGEFYNERRKVVPYEHVPKRLIQAFIASEDSSFFDHQGIDFLGTARAAMKTILKKATGAGSVQGGSTLTQQTAKAVLISAEGYKQATAKNLKRKIREAILAVRLEQALTKEEILYLYLNNVYLGHHSYGVQSAAENYYRKDVRDLTLAEMALIAGLPQAPSRYSPFLNPDAAKKRRGYVLRRMLEEGMISKMEHDEAQSAEVKVFPVEDVFHQFAPYFVEEVRKDVVERYGNPMLLNEGLKIFTTMDSEKQRAAQEAVFNGLLEVDKRQGFRGPIEHLETREGKMAFLEKSRQAMNVEPIEKGGFYVGLVTSVEDDAMLAKVQVGDETGTLPLLGMRWARKFNPEQYYPGAMISKVSTALKVGDVIVVRAVDKKQLTDDRDQYSEAASKKVPEKGLLFRLEQEPALQSAVVSIDPHRNYLVAMVGGYDFDANEFNRAFQSCRQPGSSFKPFVYAAALEYLDWSPATVIVDSPIVFDDPGNKNRWKPDNYSDEFVGDVLLRTALVNSMNIPAVKTFIAVGVAQMADFTKKMGFTTPMNADFSAALGSSCVIPYELTQAYATINRLGEQRPTVFIRKVEDRFGRVLEDHSAYDDAWAGWKDRIASGYARLHEPGKQVISKEVAFITTDLLRGVVREGTGAPAQRLGKPAAGKTGTTNDSFDTWFVGFTKDLVTASWVGYDLYKHPLGRFETGGRASLPIWLDYMSAALDGKPQGEFEPQGSLALSHQWIDVKSGKLATPGSKSVPMWFKKGTEPDERGPEKGQVNADQYMMENR